MCLEHCVGEAIMRITKQGFCSGVQFFSIPFKRSFRQSVTYFVLFSYLHSIFFSSLAVATNGLREELDIIELGFKDSSPSHRLLTILPHSTLRDVSHIEIDGEKQQARLYKKGATKVHSSSFPLSDTLPDAITTRRATNATTPIILQKYDISGICWDQLLTTDKMLSFLSQQTAQLTFLGEDGYRLAFKGSLLGGMKRWKPQEVTITPNCNKPDWKNSSFCPKQPLTIQPVDQKWENQIKKAQHPLFIKNEAPSAHRHSVPKSCEEIDYDIYVSKVLPWMHDERHREAAIEEGKRLTQEREANRLLDNLPDVINEVRQSNAFDSDLPLLEKVRRSCNIYDFLKNKYGRQPHCKEMKEALNKVQNTSGSNFDDRLSTYQLLDGLPDIINQVRQSNAFSEDLSREEKVRRSKLMWEILTDDGQQEISFEEMKDALKEAQKMGQGNFPDNVAAWQLSLLPKVIDQVRASNAFDMGLPRLEKIRRTKFMWAFLTDYGKGEISVSDLKSQIIEAQNLGNGDFNKGFNLYQQSVCLSEEKGISVQDIRSLGKDILPYLHKAGVDDAKKYYGDVGKFLTPEGMKSAGYTPGMNLADYLEYWSTRSKGWNKPQDFSKLFPGVYKIGLEEKAEINKQLESFISSDPKEISDIFDDELLEDWKQESDLKGVSLLQVGAASEIFKKILKYGVSKNKDFLKQGWKKSAQAYKGEVSKGLKIDKPVENKLTQQLGEPKLADKNIGLRWEDNKGNGVRVMKGNPKLPYKHQHSDYVQVRRGGQVIGRDQKEIKPTLEFPQPKNTESAHIPYEEWVKWDKPLGE
jgi:hypothetical protein